MSSLPMRRLAALLLAAPLALTACSSGGSSSPSGTSAASSSASLGDLKAGQSVDKTAFFQVTQAAADKNKTYAFTTEIGEGGTVMSSTGVADNRDDKDRKRQLSIKDATGGEIQIIVAGGKVYQRIGTSGPWQQAALSSRLEQLLGGATQRVSDDKDIAKEITYVGDEDVQGVKTRHFTLTVDPAKASAGATAPVTGTTTAAPSTTAATTGATASGAATSAASATTIDYWLDDQNRARKMTHVVGGLPTSTIYDKWGEDVKIDVPSADQATTAPATGPVSTATTPAATATSTS